MTSSPILLVAMVAPFLSPVTVTVLVANGDLFSLPLPPVPGPELNELSCCLACPIVDFLPDLDCFSIVGSSLFVVVASLFSPLEEDFELFTTEVFRDPFCKLDLAAVAGAA